MMGHCSIHTDTNDGALFLLLTPMMLSLLTPAPSLSHPQPAYQAALCLHAVTA
ncbi:unnamed protein product [Staurois parvus]|uniref:Uncharacterized protein n=1 Tax=Staurois parvus TaxID=386267 RepID=A0ABN9CFR5_9NEOB|nr:unnamed protein product [Staurois parvus]